MPVNYYNKHGDELYILHFPGTGFDGHHDIVDENLDRSISISNQLSIISIMNEDCYKCSPLVHQCQNNNIKIYNTAINESTWNNTIKIKHILNCLNTIDTDYVLILDGRDTLIVNDLKEDFLNMYKSFHTPIIYNGTPVAYPDIAIESLQELIKIKGKHKFLNAGVCIGERKSLIDFYTKAEEMNRNIFNNNSEQYVIRLTQHKYPKYSGVDYDSRIFRILHLYDTVVDKTNKNHVTIY